MERAKPSPERLAADRALVRSAVRGELEARRQLGERLRCVPRILYVLNARRGRPLAEAELDDLSQDVVMRVLARLGEFHGESTLEAWVHRFAFYVLMNRARSRGRESALFIAESERHEPEVEDPEPTEGYRRVEEALRSLEPGEAEVVRLKHYEELSFTQIGEALELSPNTVKTRYYRALGALKRRLSRRVARKSG